MTQSNGRLAENIIYFARALRAAGIPVGSGAVMDALTAVRVAGVGTEEVAAGVTVLPQLAHCQRLAHLLGGCR